MLCEMEKKMWLKHHELLQVVQQSWNEPIQGDPLIRFSSKLKRLKHVLIAWNRSKFGNVFQRIVDAVNSLKDAEIRLEFDASAGYMEEYNKAKSHFDHCLECEESFWRQRARAKWLKQGDKNTHFLMSLPL